MKTYDKYFRIMATTVAYKVHIIDFSSIIKPTTHIRKLLITNSVVPYTQINGVTHVIWLEIVYLLGGNGVEKEGTS